MEVTPIGWLCIAVGLGVFRDARGLALLLAFSVTFSATAVVNFPGVPFGLQPYHWFGLLLVAHVVWWRSVDLAEVLLASHAADVWLAAFLITGIASAVVTGSSPTAIAHMIHLVFGALVASCLRATLSSRRDVGRLSATVVGGAVFASVWGFLQVGAFLLGMPFPLSLFNNSAGEFAAGFGSTVAGGLVLRMSSVATEPSFLVRSLVPCLALLPVLRGEAREPAGVTARVRLAGAALVAATLLSTSTLGVLGLGFAAMLAVMGSSRHRRTVLVVTAVGALALFWSLDRFPVMSGITEEIVTGKATAGSGAERAGSIVDALDEFAESPLLGAGPGLVTSHDLVVKLLSNFGLLGAIFFLAALAASVLAGVRAVKGCASAHARRVATALLAANVLLWIMDAAAGVSYQYGVFWVLWALLGAATGWCTGDADDRLRADRESNTPSARDGDHDRPEWSSAH